MKLFSIPIVFLIFGLATGQQISQEIGDALILQGTIGNASDVGGPPPIQPRSSSYCLAEHNRIRDQHKLPRFTADSRLAAAAADHNNVMISQNCFSHQCPGEPHLGDRITRKGYRWRGAGENLAKGHASCAAAVQGWMNSPGHRANILGSNNQIGCAQRNRHYTCKFATPL